MRGALVLAVVVAAFGLGVPRQRVPLRRPVDPDAVDLGLLRRLRVPLAALCVPAGWVLIGGPVGVAAGLGAAVSAWRVLDGGEGPEARRYREELERDLPFAVHLLGACLRSGAAITAGFEAVASASGGAVAAEFRRLEARLSLGSDPAEVWADLAAGGPLAPLGQALLRAHRSGSSVSTSIDRLADDLGDAVRTAARAKARTVEVRAAAPLGLCLLPAFLLLGVVPMTVGLFRSLDFLG